MSAYGSINAYGDRDTHRVPFRDTLRNFVTKSLATKTADMETTEDAYVDVEATVVVTENQSVTCTDNPSSNATPRSSSVTISSPRQKTPET